jgi:lactonase
MIGWGRQLGRPARLKQGDILTGKARIVIWIACFVAIAGFAVGVSAQQEPASAGLAYDAQTQGLVPIPPSERSLPL